MTGCCEVARANLPIWPRAKNFRRFLLYSQILRLAYLAPDITTAILEGRQPLGLTATMLIEHPALPLSWQAQRAALGFA